MTSPAEDEPPLLRLAGVGCGYGRATVLRDVDLEVPARGVLALIGSNGSGKTTLLRVLLGLLPPRSGSIERPGGGRVAGGAPPLRVGYVPQLDVSETLFPVTALDVVLMGLTARRGPFARPGAAERRAALEALALVEAEDLAGRPFRELSGGQRQRTLLARGLAGDPELLVLDEPIRGLDFSSGAALVAAIARLARERRLAAVVATHSLDLVANHADHVALFKDGRVTSGPAGEIMNDATLSAFQGRPVLVREVEGQRVVVPGAVPAGGAAGAPARAADGSGAPERRP